MINKLVSHFQCIMALERGFSIVPCGDELLVYGKGVNNSFGTSLMPPSQAEIEAFILTTVQKNDRLHGPLRGATL